MQYGAPQQGYDQGAQQGYYQQQGYQQGYGAQALWSLHAFTGVQGHSQFSGAVSAINQDRFGSVAQKYTYLPYSLIGGDERILSRWNMLNPVPTVSRAQCKVNVAPDGGAVLTSLGSCAPTLWRSQGGQRR